LKAWFNAIESACHGKFASAMNLHEIARTHCVCGTRCDGRADLAKSPGQGAISAHAGYVAQDYATDRVIVRGLFYELRDSA